VLQFRDLQEGLAQRTREALRVRGQTGRENLHERPLQAGRDGLREGGFAGTGWSEQHHCPRRNHTVFVSEIGLGQRQDQPPLQQFLLVVHAGDVLPEVPGQNPAAQQAQRLEFLACHRNFAFKVTQVFLELEAAAEEGLHPGLGFGHQR
jgi:hypothetical protein